MNFKSRIRHLEKNVKSAEPNFSELTDDELLAFIGDDYKWLSNLTYRELEEMIRNER